MIAWSFLPAKVAASLRSATSVSLRTVFTDPDKIIAPSRKQLATHVQKGRSLIRSYNGVANDVGERRFRHGVRH